jgi:hypothetical protein
MPQRLNGGGGVELTLLGRLAPANGGAQAHGHQHQQQQQQQQQQQAAGTGLEARAHSLLPDATPNEDDSSVAGSSVAYLGSGDL